MKRSASKTLSIVFIILATLYLVVIISFNYFYDRLFVHVDERTGLDHRVSRNMFHQFSKENYFHGGRSANGIAQKEIIRHDEVDIKNVFEKEQDENMIIINHGKGNNNELLPTDHQVIESKNLRSFDKKKKQHAEDKSSRLGSLSCAAYGGPDDEAARKEMTYWRDIPGDETFVSPYKKHDKERYLTFEPDGEFLYF